MRGIANIKVEMAEILNWKPVTFDLQVLLLLVFVGIIGGCVSHSHRSGSLSDTTPPLVSFTSPADGAIGVAINTSISATFSETMDASTVTPVTFTLSDGSGPVAGTVIYSGTTAAFTPSADLAGNTAYTATITTGVKDAAGNAMAVNYVWSFTAGATADTTPPMVSSTSPADGAIGVAINTSISATFSETMDASTVTPVTFTLSGGSGPVAGTVIYSGTTAAFTPSADLAGNTAYTATITTGVKDAAGNAMAVNYTWSFTTRATPDTTPPLVSSTSPADGATGVAINGAISAAFSETMDASTLTTATFKLSDGSGPVAGTVIYSGTTAIFAPLAVLAGNTAYTAKITRGAKDAAGNALGADYVWSFTTGVAPDTTAPAFAGLEQASVLNTTTAALAWSAATDDFTPVLGIRYLIYITTSSGGYDFGSPHFITDPGMTAYEVIGLSPGQTYYFLVRAVDDSGNADSNVVEKAVALVEWHDPTGSATPVSLNQNGLGLGDEPSLAFNNDQLYAAWAGKSGPSGPNQTYVGTLTGASWTVDVSLNQDPSKSSKEATVAFKDATPYVAWSEHTYSADGTITSGDVYVKQYNGTSWVLLGGSSLTISDPGLSLIATIGHSSAVIPDTPHIAFVQKNNAGIEQLFVKRWNGVAWDLLGGSLNIDPANWAGVPVLAYVGTVPYVVWGEGDGKDNYVKRWNGATWELVGGKLNSLESSHHSWIAGDTQTVYVGWVEKDNSGVFQVYVARWNEIMSTWFKLGGSLNVDTGHDAHHARVAVAADGTVYAAWGEKDDSGVNQLYARRWDGTSWILQGGSLNVDSTFGVTEPYIGVNGNVPYVAWVETNGVEANGQVYAKTLPSP
jgi:Bacterial Ig-like domain